MYGAHRLGVKVIGSELCGIQPRGKTVKTRLLVLKLIIKNMSQQGRVWEAGFGFGIYAFIIICRTIYLLYLSPLSVFFLSFIFFSVRLCICFNAVSVRMLYYYFFSFLTFVIKLFFPRFDN